MFCWVDSVCYCFLLLFLVPEVSPAAVSFTANLRRPDVVSYVNFQELVNIFPFYAGPHGSRSGNASRSHSCAHVRQVPLSLRITWVFRPSGIHRFYRKYTEAYGIPVIGSNDVSDDALKRACYVLRFLFADHSKIRQSFYKQYGRVAVIGLNENVTDLPDYSLLPPEINHRARGLGPTEAVPVVSGAEENVLCHSSRQIFTVCNMHAYQLVLSQFNTPELEGLLGDWEYDSRHSAVDRHLSVGDLQFEFEVTIKQAGAARLTANAVILGPEQTPSALLFESTLREDLYLGEDILLHETAHGVHMAVQRELSRWQRHLVESFRKANDSGLWSNTYSSTSVEEYLAEGVQSYFGVNSYSDPPDGVHGPVNSSKKLLQYDPDLYHLIELLFPCGNVFMKPCQSNRTTESGQMLKMDCDVSGEYAFKMKTVLSDRSTPDSSAKLNTAPLNSASFSRPTIETCSDNHIYCQAWSRTGKCRTNPVYMNNHCKISCGACNLPTIRNFDLFR